MLKFVENREYKLKTLEAKIEESQYNLRMLIGKAVTLEILVQFRAAKSIYKKAIDEAEKLLEDLEDIEKDAEISKPDSFKAAYESLEDTLENLYIRLSETINQSEQWSLFNAKKFLQDLCVLPKNFGSNQIRDLKTTQEVLREKKRRINLQREARHLTNSMIFQDIKTINIDFSPPPNMYTNGTVEEIFSIDIHETFEIYQGSVSLLDKQCKLVIFKFSEMNEIDTSLRCFPKFYMAVGTAFYPLIQEASLISRYENLYVFPDFSEDIKSKHFELFI